MFCYVGYGGNGAVVILSMGLLQRLVWMSLKASKGLPQGMDSFINLSTYKTILRSSNRLSSVVIIANPLYSMGEALSSSGRLPPDEKKCTLPLDPKVMGSNPGRATMDFSRRKIYEPEYIMSKGFPTVRKSAC